MEKSNITTLILSRNNGSVLEQYRGALDSTEDWLLIIDDDSCLITSPKGNYENEYFDFVSFFWINAPKIYNRNHFGIGLYRISKLKEVLSDSNLTSEGLDLILGQRLRTQLSHEFYYLHDSKLTMKRLYRYGKGRGFFLKTCKPNKNKLPRTNGFYFRYSHYYFAYLIGICVGLLTKRKDNTWK